ncbi:MAG: hypothetical protein OEV01_11480, partial [Nitrospira sp.]|nr:hypothetical protein [Nitrospira sp.]
LQALAHAAAQVVKRFSNRRKPDGDLETLREAIAQAERTLAAQEYPLLPSKPRAPEASRGKQGTRLRPTGKAPLFRRPHP